MKIAIGSDEAAYELKEVLRTFIVDLGHEVKDFGTFDAAAAAGACPQGLLAAARGAAAAAAEGMEATKLMIATTGKARTLGERSLGHPDPGAVSMSLILQAMLDYIAA
jgi:dihydroxyacetone kinase